MSGYTKFAGLVFVAIGLYFLVKYSLQRNIPAIVGTAFGIFLGVLLIVYG